VHNDNHEYQRYFSTQHHKTCPLILKRQQRSPISYLGHAQMDAAQSNINDAPNHPKTPVTIDHLPPEIISIFFVLAICPDPYMGWPLYGENICPWREAVQLSLVCRTWRTIAVGTASLWVYLRSPRINKLDIMLSRSKSLPIMLRINRALIPQLPIFKPIAPHLQELVMVLKNGKSALSRQDARIIRRNLSCNTPILKSLTILDDESCAWGPVTELPCTITREILLVPRPALREMILNDCELPDITFPPFPHLQTFRLSNGQRSVPDASVLLRALAAMPALVSCGIRLGADAEDDLSVRVDDIPPIILPYLTSLDLDIVSYTYCAPLLSRVKTPALENGNFEIKTCCPNKHGFIHQIAIILAALGLSQNSELNRPYLRAYLHIYRTAVCLGICGFTVDHPFDQRLDVLPIDVDIMFENESDYHQVTVGVVLENLHITELEYLSVAQMESLCEARLSQNTRNQLCAMLGRHPHIRQLEFKESLSESVIETLEILRSMSNSAPPLLDKHLPKLEHLAFRSVFFPKLEAQDQVKDTLQCVVDFAEWRLARGCPMQKISFAVCRNISEEILEDLKELLPSLELT
jgi:hypothetical protein